jgi:hypothetical protein
MDLYEQIQNVIKISNEDLFDRVKKILQDHDEKQKLINNDILKKNDYFKRIQDMENTLKCNDKRLDKIDQQIFILKNRTKLL